MYMIVFKKVEFDYMFDDRIPHITNYDKSNIIKYDFTSEEIYLLMDYFCVPVSIEVGADLGSMDYDFFFAPQARQLQKWVEEQMDHLPDPGLKHPYQLIIQACRDCIRLNSGFEINIM